MFAASRLHLGTIVLLSVIVGTPARAAEGQAPLLLTTKFGELCTMCTASLACESAAGAKTTYAFATRTFLSQMSTVLDYVPGLSDQAKVHSRPVVITAADKRLSATAKFNIRDARIDLPDATGAATWIDRHNGAWHGSGEAILGHCAVPQADRPAAP